MRHARQKGRNYGLDGTILDGEAGDKIREGSDWIELGKKFEADKKTLEDEMDKVNHANISEEDKQSLRDELNRALELLQEQYETDVAQKLQRNHEGVQDNIEAMQEQVDEFECQHDSMRNVSMDAASTDASAAADAAEAKKRAFEEMRDEYTEKLRLQMEQAEIQRRNIRTKRLSGH